MEFLGKIALVFLPFLFYHSLSAFGQPGPPEPDLEEVYASMI